MPYNPCDMTLPPEDFEYEPEGITLSLCQQYGDQEYTPVPNGTGTSYPGTQVIENEYYYVEGVWSISADQELTFRNCYFKMAPGAQLIVNCNAARNVTFSGCFFFACDRLWRGIIVNGLPLISLATSNFNFQGCSIEDAARAITPGPVTPFYFDVENSNFINNYIGIYMGAASSYPLVLCKNTKFGTTGNLRPNYTGNKQLRTWPLSEAGVFMQKGYLSCTSGSQFYRMVHGLIMEGGYANIAATGFITLWQGGIAAKDAYVGVRSGTIFKGEEKIPGTNQYDIPFMQYGIYSHGSDLDVSDSHFEDVIERGIFSEGNSNAQKVDIRDSYFEQKSVFPFRHPVAGIEVERSAANGGDPHNTLYRNHCNCTLSDGLGNPPYTCFLVKGAYNAIDRMTISENWDIDLMFGQNATTCRGIAVETKNSSNYSLLFNGIFLHDASYHNTFYGIDFEPVYTSNNHIDGNTCVGRSISGEIVPYNVKCGIHVSARFGDVSLCQNAVHRTGNGIHIQGDCDYPTFSLNEMYDHDFGLFINTSPQVGWQDGRGNMWLGSYNWFAAKKENGTIFNLNDPNMLASRFWIPESNSLPYMPPGYLLSPNPDLQVNPNLKWFRYDDQISTDYCSPIASGAASLSPFQQSIAEGQTGLTGAALWDMERNLYAYLTEHPDQAPQGSAAATFMTQRAGTSVATFAQFDVAFRAATLPVAFEQNTRDQHLNALQQDMEDIRTWIQSGDTTIAQLLALQQSAEAHRTAIAASNAERQQALETSLNAAAAYNTGLTATEPWEQARKTLNALYVNTTLGQPLTEVSYQSVLAIANQLEGGSTRQEAIRLLAPCGQAGFPDESHQHEEETEERSPAYTSLNAPYQITPNPGNGLFLIQLPASQGGTLRVVDFSGRTLQQSRWTAGQRSLSVDLSGEAPGLYAFVLCDPHGQRLHTMKVILQH